MHTASVRWKGVLLGTIAGLLGLGGCPGVVTDAEWPAVYGANVTYVNQNKSTFEDDAAETRTTPPGSEGQQIAASALVGCWGSYEASVADEGNGQALGEITEALKFSADGNATHWVILEYTNSRGALSRQAFRFRGTYSAPEAGRLRLLIAEVDAVNPLTGEWELLRQDLTDVRDWPATLEQGRLIVGVGAESEANADPVYWTTFHRFDCLE